MSMTPAAILAQFRKCGVRPPAEPTATGTATRVVLPYPPTVNLYWRQFQGRSILSREARAYKLHAAAVARGAGLALREGPVRLDIDVYRPRRVGDLDNTLKGLLDSLRGVAFRDDKQVVEIRARRFDDKERPRAEVTVMAAVVDRDEATFRSRPK